MAFRTEITRRSLLLTGTAAFAQEIVAPKTPGRYNLKFDLVSEGIDWFERCGSPTTTRTLLVM